MISENKAIGKPKILGRHLRIKNYATFNLVINLESNNNNNNKLLHVVISINLGFSEEGEGGENKLLQMTDIKVKF